MSALGLGYYALDCENWGRKRSGSARSLTRLLRFASYLVIVGLNYPRKEISIDAYPTLGVFEERILVNAMI